MDNPAGESKNKIIVQKYGGATLATPEKIKLVARRIARKQKSGYKIIAVVSAMGQTTNDLIRLAQQVSSRPTLREMDMLLSVGERVSMSLLSMALNDLGCTAISLTGSQAGILTDDLHANANIMDVKAFRVEQALSENKIVILAGFQGVSAVTKEVTTLGRGGSDISAVAMAEYLKAERCEILKDVDGVYTADPRLVPDAKRIRTLSTAHFLEMTSWGAKVLNSRSVQLALDKNVPLYIASAENETIEGTLITNTLQSSSEAQKPLALNSFKKIFEIKFENSMTEKLTDNFSALSDNTITDMRTDPKKIFEDFESYLRTHNINGVHLLRCHEKSFFVWATDEVLSALADFEKEQSYFRIADSSLSSLSLTLSHPCREADFQKIYEILISSATPVRYAFYAGYSCHFFLAAEMRNTAVQKTHCLFNELIF